MTIMNLYECIICYEKKCDKCTIIKNYHSNLCSNQECILINNRRTMSRDQNHHRVIIPLS